MAGKGPPGADDQELVRAWLEGTPGARQQLIRRFKPLVERNVTYLLQQYGFAHLIGEHREEIVQQVWIALFQSPGKSPDEKFSTWLGFLTRWRTLDYIRKELAYRGRVVAAGGDPEEQGTPQVTRPADPEELLHRSEFRANLLLCLKKMSPRHRQFILLYYYRGWTYDQIAGRMGVTVGTVGSIHTRAIRKLKQLLGKKGKKALFSLLITL